MSLRRTATLLTVVLAGTLGLSSCGASSSDRGPPASSSAVSSGEAGTANGTSADGGLVAAGQDRSAAADQGDESGGDESLSPLGAFLGYEIPGLDVGDDLELRRIHQDILADCMRDEGFTYVAWTPDPEAVFVPVEDGLDPDSREFAAKYGFGISTQFFAQSDVGPGLLGHNGDGSGVDFEDDPNATIRNALTAEEAEAYDKAFWGPENPIFAPPSEYDEEAEGMIWGRAISSYGCIGRAERSSDGDAGEILDVFGIEILTMPQQARADARYLDHSHSVERCVHDAGFDFYVNEPAWTVLSYFDDLVNEVDELVGGNPITGLTEADLAAMSPEEIDALYDVPRELSGAANDRLAEVQDLETATATAVWDCGGSVDEQRRVVDEIMVDLQTEFIETNRDELERFRR